MGSSVPGHEPSVRRIQAEMSGRKLPGRAQGRGHAPELEAQAVVSTEAAFEAPTARSGQRRPRHRPRRGAGKGGRERPCVRVREGT